MALTPMKSLRPDSKATYFGAQIRRTDGHHVRVQMRKCNNPTSYTEPLFLVDGELAAYIDKLPTDSVSFANSGAKYVTCRVTIHTDSVQGYDFPVRFQVAGPKVNRDWGVEFVLDSEILAANVTGALAALTTPKPSEDSPAMGKAAKTPPVVSAKDDEDDEDED